MAPGGESHEARNASNWFDQKQPSFFSLTCSDNTKLETVDVYMIVDEYNIRKATCRVNALIEQQGCNNFPRYHIGRFHTYRNCPKNMDPDVTECAERSIQEYD